MKIRHGFLAVLVLTGILGAVASPQKKSVDPIKVYIFTEANDGGFVDQDLKRRSDSVEDLKKALDKKDLIQIVPQKEGADVTLEVLGRGGEETGSTTTERGAFGTWNTSRDTVATVRVGLRVGTYAMLIDGRNDGRITNVWRTAANNAAKNIENWIRANHDRLIAQRAK